MPRLLRAVLLGCALLAAPAQAADAIAFWDQPRAGGGQIQRGAPGPGLVPGAKDLGATWTRLGFSKWKGEGRDFLIGDAERYDGLVAADLAVLRTALDAAQAAGLQVAVTPLSLPGARWRQQNGGRFDDRLWSEPAFADQAAAFWRDLAVALKDHPGVAAYDILNEPAPGLKGGLPENAPMAATRDWQASVAGAPRDLACLLRPDDRRDPRGRPGDPGHGRRRLVCEPPVARRLAATVGRRPHPLRRPHVRAL